MTTLCTYGYPSLAAHSSKLTLIYPRFAESHAVAVVKQILHSCYEFTQQEIESRRRPAIPTGN